MSRAPGDYTGLTVKQADLLSYLRTRQAAGVTPSYQEMQDALGLSSKSGVFRLVDALEERGYAGRMRNRARAIEVFPARRMPTGSLASYPMTDLLDEMARRGVRVQLA